MTFIERTVPLVLLLAGLAGAAPTLAAAPKRTIPSTFPVDSVRAGMVGVGLSVFEGTRIDSFPITILGVIKGQRPGATIILARAQGAYLERTGIIAGMSGSPVYINGRLLGAVAYTWAFSKDPVGGITPIGEMLDLFPTGGTPPSEDAEGRLGAVDGEPGSALADPSGARPI
jgi:hypothetical protein